jgi:hypothetical protein
VDVTPRKPRRRSQLVFSAALRRIANAGLISAALSYAFYISGALPGLLSPQATARLWDRSPAELRRASGLEPGWAWLRHMACGDVLSFAALVFIASGSALALLRALPAFLAERNLIHALLAMALLVALVLAAAGAAR